MTPADLDDARARALAMVSEGRPLAEILCYLVNQAEEVSDGEAVCSVLVIDKDGLLRNGASPGLPASYLAAIDRLRPNPDLGKVVITRDFLSDAAWSELRHLPLALGLRSAWSMPITAVDGRVLGTFGTYFREAREPRPEERSAVEGLARIAGATIEASPQPAAV